MKNIKKIICSILVFALVMTNTLIFPLPASAAGTAPVALNSLTAGDTVSFGGVTWIVVEPGNGLLLMKDYYSTYLGSIEISSFAFDSSGSTSYDPSSTTNIAYRLNNEFYNSLGSDSALILSQNWPIGPLGHESSSTVNCKIGMINMSQATYAYTTSSNILGSISGDWWTLTPMDGGGVNLRSGSGGIGGSVDATYSEMVRPALHLSPIALVSGGNGGTVLGGSHNIPAVTGISPVGGSSQGGTEVTVSGTGLSEATEVYFGSTAGTITGASDTFITVTAPEGTGVVDITVTNPYGTSQTSSADQFQYIPTQATPAFSPAAGEVDFGTELQLISTGAEHIYYTTDGTDPDTSSTEYDDDARPVINSAMTVKAIATASGKEDSIVASASYTQAASADLTDIVVSGAPGNFIFTPDQYTYNGLTVASGVETVTVTPTGAGVITVNGTEVASGHASADIALTGGVEENITVAATETGKSPKAYSIKITRTQPVASITKNGVATNYDTLSAALADAHNDTITLLRDVTESVVLAATMVNTITIDGQGHTITGEEEAGQSSVALTLSGDGNVILKSLTLQGGGAPNSDSSGLLVSGGSVNVLCEGTVNAYGVSNNSSVSSGLIHSGSGSVNITNATGGSSAQLASYGVQNSGAGTVNVANATAGSSDISYGVSYGVYNSGAGTVNVTNASGSSARQSVGVFNHGTGSVNVASASGGAATYYSFGVNNTQSGGSVNVANASMVPGGTYGNEINGVAVNMDVTTLKLNRGPGESCVLDTITIASAGTTTIGILPGVQKDGVVYSWYKNSAKTDLFSGTTVTGTTDLYIGLPAAVSAINISEISGVTVPVTGETPVSSIADTDQYTASISWSPNDTVFAENTIYTATITITPKNGYTLIGVAEDFFSVPKVTTTNLANSGVVTAVFPVTDMNASLSLGSVNYNLNAPADVVTNITWNGASTVTDVVYGTTSLTTPDVYAVTGSALTIRGSYIAALGLSKGSRVEFTIHFDQGASATLTVDIVDGSEPVTHSITLQSDGNGTVSANVHSAPKDTEITLTAVPDSGYRFREWQVLDGGVTVTDNKFIMPDNNVTVKAIFEQIPAAAYQVTINGSYAAASGAGSYAENTAVTIRAGLRSGYTFVGWTSSDGVSFASAGSTDTTFTMPGKNVTVTANWSYNGGSGGGGISTGGSAENSAGDSNTSSGQDTLVIGSNPAKGWEALEKMIEKSETGTAATITVDMGNTSVVPKSIFEALKGKDITLTFVLTSGAMWIVNGRDITGGSGQSDSLKDIDLKVVFGTGNIPENLLSELQPAQGTSLQQLSLAYEGSFGFVATLRIRLDSQDAGRSANLFYYNRVTGTLSLQSVGTIGEDGSVALGFTHASDYVILTDDGETLKVQMDKISVAPLAKTLYIGGTTGKNTTLKIKNPDSIAAMIENKTGIQSISYRSSNPKVASVSASGMVTPWKAGKATVTTTVTMNGVSVSFQSTITVKKAYIRLVKSTQSMEKGEVFTFQAKGYGISNSKITWSTAKKSILVVDKETGRGTAKTAGTDYVVAKAGNVTTKLKVVV
jgi:uncharacterized repeat protein (TIGR02543 family)